MMRFKNKPFVLSLSKDLCAPRSTRSPARQAQWQMDAQGSGSGPEHGRKDEHEKALFGQSTI